MDPRVVRQRLDSWREEKNSAYLYGIMVSRESGRNRELFDSLGKAAQKQAGLWAEDLIKGGVPMPAFSPSARARFVGLLLRAVHPRHMLPILAAMKVRGLGVYRGAAAPIPELGEETGGEPVPLLSTPTEQARHRAGRGGGALRAAVFGINDGLVSNASLILGMAGAQSDPEVIVVAGVAGLLAGGFSMGAGEYVSVRTQREVYEQQIALEWEEIQEMPEEEIAELTEIYVAKGMPREQAAGFARRIIANPVQGLQTLAREELGLDPEMLGSPWGAAAASFFSFAAGAIVPLLPFLLFAGAGALPAALGLSLGALMLVGAAMSLFTGRSAVYSALRMALIGGVAAALTWTIGRIFDVAVS